MNFESFYSQILGISTIILGPIVPHLRSGRGFIRDVLRRDKRYYIYLSAVQWGLFSAPLLRAPHSRFAFPFETFPHSCLLQILYNSEANVSRRLLVTSPFPQPPWLSQPDFQIVCPPPPKVCTARTSFPKRDRGIPADEFPSLKLNLSNHFFFTQIYTHTLRERWEKITIARISGTELGYRT